MSITNIPQPILAAIIYIIALDERQLSEGSGGPGTFKWEDWGWKLNESKYWTAKRLILEPLMMPYANKISISTEQRNLIKQTIEALRKYAGSKVGGHRLIQKISAFGDNKDWVIANVKLGTPLAKKPSKEKKASNLKLKKPVLSIVLNALLVQKVTARNPDNPNLLKMPDGIKFIKIYLYIGTKPPKSLDDYKFYDNAKRGSLIIKFEEFNLSGKEKIYAYYFARYESKKGVLGLQSNVVNAEILLPGEPEEETPDVETCE